MWKLRAYIEILRPMNAIMMAIGVFSGAVISTGEIKISFELIIGAIACALFTGFANLTNDIIDLEVDRINEPQRPIPSGRLEVREALNYSFLIIASAIMTTSLTCNIWWILVTPFVALLCVLYNIFLKGVLFIGNILISFLVALSFVGGGVIATDQVKSNLVLFSFMAFMANLGREVHKSIIDVEGDSARGIRTIATALGTDRTRKLASALYVITILLAPMPHLIGFTNELYPFLMIIVCGLALFSIYRLLRTKEKTRLRFEKNLIRFWMFLAMLSMIIGRITI